MTAERHLIIQDLSLRPSGEWKPDAHGWTVFRVADGAGYCLQGSGARELNVGDMAICSPATTATIRASQLGALRLEFYLVLPQCLNGLLTVTEWRQLEELSRQSAPSLLHFAAADPTAQKYTRLSGQTRRDCLATRSTLLQLWATSVTNLLPAHAEPSVGGHLRERFRQLIGKMAEAELASRSLTELAEELHCSERHFSRLFREEFKVSLRSCQTELRLQRARQLLTTSNQKIINIAYESGFRHLGLFNAMFKRRFGITPSGWRHQNAPPPAENLPPRLGSAAALMLLLAMVFFSPVKAAETTNTPAATGSVTNRPARGFNVQRYHITGNTVLPPEKLGALFTNVPEAFGTNVTIDGIRAAVKELQTSYRERGFVTVSVGLPPQKLTNGIVKVKVIEGRLAVINVTGNDHFSTANVLRALPSLHTNMLLNSHVFQRELDMANASRDRSIYPVIGPGPDPGTSEITLKVKDRFPLHARVEYNNTGTVGTPDDRVNFSAQYGNLWQLEHQIGIQYAFSPLNYATANNYYFSPLDLPQVANGSAYYRMPLGQTVSVQEQVDTSKGQFGYNEVTHQFVMPPPSGRPELTIYASRAVTDSGIIQGDLQTVLTTNLFTITSQTAGQNVTLNEGIGLKLSEPLPPLGPLNLTLLFGVDFKRYQQVSFNTNNFYTTVTSTNAQGNPVSIVTTIPHAQAPRQTEIDYLPLNAGFSGSAPDPWGSTSFNGQVNLNVAANANLSTGAYTTNARNNYVTVQAGVTRDQRLYHDWDVLIHADGQWASTPLFSNEQYEIGGSGGVRGYPEGQSYGDTGWRVSVEPRTPLINIGMVDDDIPFWIRSSVFVDYGQDSVLDGFYAVVAAGQGPVISQIPHNPTTLDFCGTGWSLTANIGSHLDARLTVAFPLINTISSPGWDPVSHAQVYFAIGGQF
jgi:hemolysin activation/secretion protein/AraC-like DNA-binding protein